MKKPFDPTTDWESLQAKVIGLGEQSLRKSHYAQSRERLRELELFRRLLDASEEIVLVANLASGTVVDANGGACRQLGYRHDELIGLPLEMICAQNGRRLLRQLRTHEQRDERRLDLEIRRCDGSRFRAEGTAGIEQVGDDQYACLIARDISQRLRADAELRAARDAVDALNVTLEQRVRQRTAELAAALDELRDLNTSLERAQGQLVQAETLAGLGRMVAVIAHELNTPIGNSRISASTLHDEAIAFVGNAHNGLRRSELEAFLERVAQGTALLDRSLAKAANLIASFKQVAVDQTTAQRREFDLAVVIAEIRATLEPALKRSRCRVIWQVDSSVVLDSYPGPLGQVLINLIDNALQHAFDGIPPGTLAISSLADAEGETVRIIVADDGIGITEADRKRVFEPFFTTKLGRGGTGLGLNIAYNIVSRVLGGDLTLVGDGPGSRFEVAIPRRAPVPPAA